MSIKSRLKQLAIKLFDIKELDYPHRYLAMKHPEELEKAKKADQYWLGMVLTRHHLQKIDDMLDKPKLSNGYTEGKISIDTDGVYPLDPTGMPKMTRQQAEEFVDLVTKQLKGKITIE
jgi:hypothetical protein